MAKVKTRAKFEIIELIDRFIDKRTAEEIGNTLVKEAKQLVSEGTSPVRGHGRFARYKDRDKYPLGNETAQALGKKARPVNLTLTGEMLAGLSFKQTSKAALEWGFTKLTGKKKKIAEYHTSGTDHMAMRRVVPQEGEEFAVTIMRRLRDIYAKRLADLARISNRSKK